MTESFAPMQTTALDDDDDDDQIFQLNAIPAQSRLFGHTN